MIRLRPLEPFTPSARPKVVPAVERCEICGTVVPEAHRHIVDLERRGLACACHACAILFVRAEPGGRFRTVPDRVIADATFAMSAAAWSALGVPVGLAFVFYSSPLARHVVCYPGPAGVTEAEPPPGLWEALVAATPLARTLVPDVEAVLVHGERGAPQLSCFLIPIDAAYALSGRLRRCWRGFSGGDEAERELRTFFADLARRSKPLPIGDMA